MGRLHDVQDLVGSHPGQGLYLAVGPAGLVAKELVALVAQRLVCRIVPVLCAIRWSSAKSWRSGRF